MADEDATLSMLLDLMREPAASVLSIDERCYLEPNAIGKRELRIQLSPQPGRLFQILDVKHPKKGTVSPLELIGPARTLRHQEHVDVSRGLIRYRFMTLMKSVETASLTPDEVTNFDNLMAITQVALVSIPTASPEAAARLFRENFTKINGGWSFTPFESLQIEAFSGTDLNGLARLCKRLVYRYLKLIRVELASYDGAEVILRYQEEMDRSAVIDPRPHQILQRSRKLAKEWINAPSPSLRFHIPWVKRTGHYTFTIDAPPHRFFSLQSIIDNQSSPLAPRSNDSNEFEPSPLPFAWAINAHQGLKSQVFVSGASDHQNRLYIALRALELPGRSMLRMMSISFLVMGVLTVLTAWRHLGVTGLPQAASLIPAVLAIGAFALQPSHFPGVLGYPARSRSTPAFLAILCVAYIFWIASTGALRENATRIPFTFSSFCLSRGRSGQGSAGSLFWQRDTGIVLGSSPSTIRRSAHIEIDLARITSCPEVSMNKRETGVKWKVVDSVHVQKNKSRRR